MTALSLIVSVMVAWYPTIDSQRVEISPQFAVQAELPYWLGISAPELVTEITVTWGDLTTTLDNYTGTDWYLLYIDDYCQVTFHENGIYQGSIIPEPATIWLLLGAILLRRRTF